jgi:hypothetical protein
VECEKAKAGNYDTVRIIKTGGKLTSRNEKKNKTSYEDKDATRT